MQHCTNCGAAAREGAKFCTSCGVRLEPGVTLDEAPQQESQDTAVYTAAAETDDTAGAPAAQDADEPATTVTSYEQSWPDADAPTASPEPEAADPVETAAPSDESLAGWPEPDTTPAEDETQAEPEPDEPLAGWGAASETPADTGSDATMDADPQGPVDAGRTEDTNEPETQLQETGASEWEGWSPTPSPDSAVHHQDDAALREIRQLVDTLQQLLDRLADPAPLGARGVDADELADNLSRWASDGPASDDLLWVIQDARANPRGLDALTRLADRADELERLVERYGTICTDAERWVARLRHHDGSPDA